MQCLQKLKPLTEPETSNCHPSKVDSKLLKLPMRQQLQCQIGGECKMLHMQQSHRLLDIKVNVS